MEEFKGNSLGSNQNEHDEPKIKKVISGKAVVKKESTGTKFFKAFLADDMNKLKDHIVYDVIVPAIKATIDDIIHNLLYPNDSRKSSTFIGSSISTNSRTSYGDYYEKKDRHIIQQNKSNNLMDPIFFEYRSDADEVLWNLQNMIDSGYDVTIADVYDAAGITCHNYMANKYGWSSLAEASVIKAGRNGYTIRFPEPIVLK